MLDAGELAEWVVETCLLFGASVPTAYQVAGLFVQAIHENATLETKIGEN